MCSRCVKIYLLLSLVFVGGGGGGVVVVVVVVQTGRHTFGCY